MAKDNAAAVRETITALMEELRKPSVTFKAKNEYLHELKKVTEVTGAKYDLNGMFPPDEFAKIFGLLLTHPTKSLRTSALRTLRCFIRDATLIKALNKHGVPFLVTRSLEKANNTEAERLQAVKLVRKILEVDASNLSRAFAAALVALAEVPEDALSRIALQTLCEIAIRNPQLASTTGALRAISNAVLDPVYEKLHESILVTILFVLDDPKSRVYTRPGADIRVMLAPITSLLAPEGVDREKRWRLSVRAMIGLLRSWTGLILLSSDELGMHTLVDALSLPSIQLREIVLDGIYEMLRLPLPKSQENPFARDASKDSDAQNDMNFTFDLPSRTRGARHNLLNNYTAALLMSLIKAGVIEVLVQLGNDVFGEEMTKDISNKATILLGEILHLSSPLLPSATCASLQSLPTLVHSANNFLGNNQYRYKASAMVANLHIFSLLKEDSLSEDVINPPRLITGANKWRRAKGRDKRLDRLDEIKRKLDSQMDETAFLNGIKESLVPQFKAREWNKWRWDLVSELVEGPLTNASLMATCLKQTKFVSRILAFLKPAKGIFAKLPWTPNNLKYARIACQLFEVLISSNAGYSFLETHPILGQLAAALKMEADTLMTWTDMVGSASQKGSRLTAPASPEARTFSIDAMLKTMAREYFTILGTLSSSTRGLELMKKVKAWDYLSSMPEIPGRDDLANAIITSLDYNVEAQGTTAAATVGQSRGLLAKFLSSNSKVVRYFATRHLRILLRAGVFGFSTWAIQLIIKQVADTDAKVAQVALQVLEEAADEEENLEALIQRRPNLLELGKPGRDLTLRFLGLPSGYKLCNDTGLIANEMKTWRHSECLTYTLELESKIGEAFSSTVWRNSSDQQQTVVHPPPHFFGELVKTVQGCEAFSKSGYLPIVLDSARNGSSAERRSALWTLGHLGSSPTGLQFLISNNVIPLLVEIAESSPVLSLRGTAFTVIGMISRTEQARAKLAELGWSSPRNATVCVSVPSSLTSRFFKTPPYASQASWTDACYAAVQHSYTDERAEILSHLSELSCHITIDAALKNLKRLKQKHPEHFLSSALFFEALRLLENIRFKLPARRFIYDLFGSVIWTIEAFGEYARRSAAELSSPSSRPLKDP